MHLQLQDIAKPKTTGPNTNPSELQSVAKAGFRTISSLCNLDAEFQDIAEPKTNPSQLHSAAKAGFRTISSLCNVDARATP